MKHITPHKYRVYEDTLYLVAENQEKQLAFDFMTKDQFGVVDSNVKSVYCYSTSRFKVLPRNIPLESFNKGKENDLKKHTGRKISCLQETISR